MKDRYVKINDINTRFWAAGSEGPALLLIHGLGRYLDTWQLNVDALAKRYRVYALDLVGFGRSDKPSVPYSIPYLTRFAKDFLNKQGIENATIIGNSMGGAIALHMAFSYPELIDSLVLVNPVGFGTRLHIGLRLATIPFIAGYVTRPSRMNAHMVLKTIIFDKSIITEEMIDVEFNIASLPGSSKALISTARSFLGFGGVSRNYVKFITTNVHRLRCPTLVIWGKQDKILPVAQAYRASSMIPNPKLKLFDACGHTPQLEHPHAFNAAVIEFLSGLDQVHPLGLETTT